MSKLTWDLTGERFYETGVDHGVLYPQVAGAYPKGVAWNGLIGVSENPTGAEPNPLYADNIKYLNLMSVEEFEAGIEAYTYPEEFAACDGSVEAVDGVMVGQQPRKPFGLVYRTRVGNDTEGHNFGYKLHLVYGALAGPSEKAYETINDTPDAITFSWDITTTPVEFANHAPTASLTLDSTKFEEGILEKLEKVLFGDADEEPRLPLPAEVLTILATV